MRGWAEVQRMNAVIGLPSYSSTLRTTKKDRIQKKSKNKRLLNKGKNELNKTKKRRGARVGEALDAA